MIRTVKPSHAANPDMARAMQGKRTSGAAGAHGDRRTKRTRDRGASRRNAIREAS